ncbi:hypothetical protein Cni_G24879 [Canna indica]|uniref:Uncharacterized protein n=1 Tax=Canna indica TaxID=4628 RepID=A0AAQ3L3A8_9LILI|nr:hypothetical protein Cni_G24879 [Canna indica]
MASTTANEEKKRSDRRCRSRIEDGSSSTLKGGAGGITLEGYVDAAGGPGGFAMTMSLTGEDLDELKGCFDLGFSFSHDEIPGLRSTLPALELYYSMSQSIHLDDQPDRCPSPASPPLPNWRISSPGDNPDEVKARLKYWAQAVACTLKLCS